MLTVADIHLIFDKIGREVVVPASKDFRYEIVTPGASGYSQDPAISALQAKLSIMLQVASEREERAKG